MTTNYHHEHGKPCPITGKDTKGLSLFTDHSRPGCYNWCAHCHDDKRTLAERLADLAGKRGAE